MKPLSEAKIETIFFYCSDFKTMFEFYVDKLGLQVAHKNDHFAALKVPGGGNLALHSGRQEGNIKPNSDVMIEFAVKQIENVREQIIGLGIDVSAVSEEPFGKICHFYDPEGHLLGLEEA